MLRSTSKTHLRQGVCSIGGRLSSSLPLEMADCCSETNNAQIIRLLLEAYQSRLSRVLSKMEGKGFPSRAEFIQAVDDLRFSTEPIFNLRGPFFSVSASLRLWSMRQSSALRLRDPIPHNRLVSRRLCDSTPSGDSSSGAAITGHPNAVLAWFWFWTTRGCVRQVKKGSCVTHLHPSTIDQPQRLVARK